MPKFKTLRNEKSSARIRRETYGFYMNKYYSIYMNRYKINGVDYQAKEFILKRFWADGTISSYQIKETKGSKDYPKGMIIFTPYAPNAWNLYDYPVDVNLINTKGLPFIPSKSLKVDEEVVIGFCQRNHKSVFQMVEYYVEKIVNIEIVIDLNLTAHKMPFIFGVDPEDTKKFEEIFRLLQNDEPSLFVSLNEADKFKALVSGAPYILDKLYNLKEALENELREYLGLDNLGGSEKKEHLITSEVEANNDVIETSGNCFIDCMKEFFDRTNELFGSNITIEINKKEQVESSPEDEQEEEVQDENV